MVTQELKELHDQLLEMKPEDAVHEPCALCANVETASDGGSQMADEKIYDQQTVDTLVASAVEKAVTEAKDSMDKEIVRLNAELEKAQSDLETAQAEKEKLEGEIRERDEQARLDVLADDRATQVRDLKIFSDDQIDERKERWAKASDEDFTELLSEYKMIADAATKKKVDGDKAPDTLLDTARDNSQDSEQSSVVQFLTGLG